MFKNADLWECFKKYKERREKKVMLKDATQPQRETWIMLEARIEEQLKSIEDLETMLSLTETEERKEVLTAAKRSLNIMRLAHSECVRMLHNLRVEISSAVCYARYVL